MIFITIAIDILTFCCRSNQLESRFSKMAVNRRHVLFGFYSPSDVICYLKFCSAAFFVVFVVVDFLKLLPFKLVEFDTSCNIRSSSDPGREARNVLMSLPAFI